MATTRINALLTLVAIDLFTQNIKKVMSKTKTIISWVLAAFLALGLLFAGITKLAGAEMQIKNLESWGYPLWLRFPIGLFELVFPVTVLIPA